MKNFNKIFYTFLISFVLISTTGYSQYQNLGNAQRSESGLNPWFVGGMIGGSISNLGGSFEISPLVGYKVTEDFHVGSRLTYIYNSYDYGGNIGKKSFNNYGGSLFARHKFLNMLFAQVEYEVLSVEYFIDQSRRKTINSLFVGGGFFQQMGGSGFATIAILYNVLETEYSPYSNPVVRIGFGVGL